MAATVAGAAALVALATSAAAESLTVDVDTSRSTHVVDPLFMGCHSDSGFAHTERNFYAQMIYGESFEFGNQSSWHYIYPAWDPSPTAATLGGLKWNSAVDPTAKATIGYDQAEAHHGYASLKLDYTSGSGTAGVTNRGIGNEGLFLKSGLEYEGYFFAKSSKPAKMVVMLRNWETKAVLGTQEIAVAASSNWTKYPFTMTASNGTTCEGIKPGSNPEVSCNTQRKGMASEIFERSRAARSGTESEHRDVPCCPSDATASTAGQPRAPRSYPRSDPTSRCSRSAALLPRTTSRRPRRWPR